MVTTTLNEARTSRSADGSMPVVSARGINFSMGKGDLAKQILFGVDLDLWPGEIVLLTGPSGSGKSTLLTLIGGLRTVSSGHLTVLQTNLHETAPCALMALRRRIGFVFQTHNLLDFLTVRQNVELAFDLHPHVPRRDAQNQSMEILKAVGLGQYLNHHPSELSHGQRQRVALARALVTQPELILADEPTAALDRQVGRDVVKLLEQLARRQNCPVLMVTHDNRVLDVADRVIEMEDGRLS